MTFVDVDGPGAADEQGVPFEEALGSLIRQAERDGVDVTGPRDVDAVGEGTWTVEITKVDPGGSRTQVDPAELSLDPGHPSLDPDGVDSERRPVD